jgi:hypothetical protein
LHQKRDFDVIIAGGGISGISTALQLQKAGLNCAVLEAHTLCFGTTGGTTAHLNTLMDTPYSTLAKRFGADKARLVADAAKDALSLIGANIGEHFIECGFRSSRACLFSKDEAQSRELDELAEACKEAGLSCNYRNSLEIPFHFDKALNVEGQAKFHPTRYVFGLARAFEAAGGAIFEHCAVPAVENRNHLSFETPLGSFRCSWLIYTTHIPPGVNLFNLRCAPYRTYAMAFLTGGAKYPEDLYYDMEDPYHYYRAQQIGGKTYLIAGGEDHKTGHCENTRTPFLRLEAHIRSHFKVEEITHAWSSQYFEPTDGLPYIGHMAGKPGNILVATGYGGNGMTYSSVAALVLTRLITGKTGKYDLVFDPNRVSLAAGFSNFVRENADVGKEWLSRLLPTEKLPEFADLAPGEGRIAKYEEHLLALYKDEQGKLYLLHAVCPHMHCTVTWNAAERSWDCPCHGARYDVEGNVLTGPAECGLKKIER